MLLTVRSRTDETVESLNIMIKVYRYEREDGGGPWFTRQGICRFDPEYSIKNPANTLYGCISLEYLEKYFSKELGANENCTIKEYTIPEENIVKYCAGDYGEVEFHL